MKFNTTRQKLPKLWEKSKANVAKTVNQINVNNKIFVSTEKINVLLNSQQKFVDLSTDFQNLDEITTSLNGNMTTGFKGYSFRIPLIKEEILDSIFYEFVYRFGNGIDESEHVSTEFKHGMIIDRKSGELSANLNLSFVARTIGGVPREMQVKLILLVFNPNLYYKQ